MSNVLTRLNEKIDLANLSVENLNRIHFEEEVSCANKGFKGRAI